MIRPFACVLLLAPAVLTGCAGNQQFWAASAITPQPQSDYATRMTRVRTAMHAQGLDGAAEALTAEIGWAQARAVHPVHQHELPLLHRELGIIELERGQYARATAAFDLAWKLSEERLIAAHDTRGRPVFLPWQFWGPAALPFDAPAHEVQLLPTYAALAWLERGQPREALVEVRRIEVAQSVTRGERGAAQSTTVSSEISAFVLSHGGAGSRVAEHSSYIVGDGVDTLIVVHAGRGPSKEIEQLQTRREMGLLAQFPLEGKGPVLRAPRPTEQLGLLNKYGTRYLPELLPTFPGPVLRTRPPCVPAVTVNGAPLEPLARLDVHDVAGSAWARTRAFDVSMSMSMALNTPRPEGSAEGQVQKEVCSAHPTHCGADTRFWANLPASVAVARTSLPAGLHEIDVRGCDASATRTVSVGGSWSLVQIWVH